MTQLVKNPLVNAGDIRDASSILGWEGREWLPTPVLLPVKSQGQKSLEGYSPWGPPSPWGHKESDRTEWLTLSHSVLFLRDYLKPGFVVVSFPFLILAHWIAWFRRHQDTSLTHCPALTWSNFSHSERNLRSLLGFEGLGDEALWREALSSATPF